MSWFDLHMHTHFSDDGTYSPEELMELCAQNGRARCRCFGSQLQPPASHALCAMRPPWESNASPPVELDCTYQGIDLHLLGYWIDPDHPGFSQTEQAIQKQEQLAGEQRIQLAYSMGFQFDAEPLRRGKGRHCHRGNDRRGSPGPGTRKTPPFSPTGRAARAAITPMSTSIGTSSHRGSPLCAGRLSKLRGSRGPSPFRGRVARAGASGKQHPRGHCLVARHCGARGARDRSVQQLPLPRTGYFLCTTGGDAFRSCQLW